MPPDRVTKAVKEAQAVLARYIEPGLRDCQKTINDLVDVLDDEELVEAMEKEDAQGTERAEPRRSRRSALLGRPGDGGMPIRIRGQRAQIDRRLVLTKPVVWMAIRQ